MSALHHLRLLGRVLLALQACLIATQAAIVEIDLVFPRNDTYAPGRFMPVVFAIKNPSVATRSVAVVWEIFRVDAASGVYHQRGVVELGDTNITGPNPFFRADYAWGLNGTETNWLLNWGLSLRAPNCYKGPWGNVSRDSEEHLVWFSTKPGSSGPNLVQGPGTCANSGMALNVTDIIQHIPEPSEAGREYNSCLVLSPPESGHVPADPCTVTVNETTAAAILGDRCGPVTATTCLPVSSAPTKRTQILVSWLFPMLAGLVLYITV